MSKIYSLGERLKRIMFLLFNGRVHTVAGSVLLVFIVFVANQSLAASLPCDKHGQQRPSVGLALSGGGARGVAHIGVLKVLEELRIPIDCIAGTSMGSVMGGLYASGMTTDELAAAVEHIDWEGVFDDEPDRVARTFRRKADDLLFLIKRKPRVKDGDVKISSGLVQGQKFDLVLSELTLGVKKIGRFDQLDIPFRAVATDITNGQEVVLGSGSLAKAMRASMAVPAAFAAVEIDGRLLVDGGIANNLPISVVRDMGAEVVIAVDISTPLSNREELNSALAILNQLSGLLTRRNVEEQLATLTDRDILIVPELGDITSADFDRALLAVPFGQTAAEAKRPALARYSLPAVEYQEYVSTRQLVRKSTEVESIDFIRIESDSRVSDEAIAAQLDYKVGGRLDLDALEKGIGHVYGMDIFESVRYEVVEEAGKTGIVVHAKEKSWGTDYIQGGLELSADLDGDSFFNIGAAYTKMPLNRLNGEWRTIGYLGEEPSLLTEIYQPLDPAERWFVNAGVAYQSRNVKLFVDREPIAEYDVDQYGVALTLGYNLTNQGRLQAEWRRFWGDADVAVGTGVDGFDFDVGEVRVAGLYDSLDSLYFPRDGLFGSAVWVASREDFGADDNFDRYQFNLGGARSWGDHTLLGSVRYETTPDDDAPIQSLSRLGGFLRLSGLQQNELSGQHAALLLGGYMYRLTDKLVPTYLGASLEVGNVWQDSDDIGDDTLLAGSIYLGADTIVGPMYLSYGHAEGGENAFYIFLGQPWFSR